MEKPETWTKENLPEFLAASDIASIWQNELGRDELLVSDLCPDCATEGFKLTIDDGRLVKHCRNKQCYGERLKLRLDVPSLDDLRRCYPLHIERKQVIQGIYRAGDTVNVVSGTKGRKTWFAMDQAISIAAGVPFLNFPTKQGKVAYFDNELRQDDWLRRANHIIDAKGLKWQLIEEELSPVFLRGKLADVSRIRDHVFSFPREWYSAIFVDALYKALPADCDENSNTQMKNAYCVLDDIAEQHGCAVVSIVHAAKGDNSKKAITDIGSGAGAISRSVDCHIVLRQYPGIDEVQLEATIRSMPSLKPLVLKFDFPLWKVVDGKTGNQLKTEQAKNQAVLLFDLVSTDWHRRSIIIEQAQSQLGFGEKLATRLIAQLVRDGKLEQQGGKPILIRKSNP